jgi:hypothetical protein
MDETTRLKAKVLIKFVTRFDFLQSSNFLILT